MKQIQDNCSKEEENDEDLKKGEETEKRQFGFIKTDCKRAD